MTYLYGLENASKNFTTPASFGKNTFTNAFPLALTQYMAVEKEMDIPVVRATMGADGHATTEHVKTPWTDIIHTDPRNAYFDFETFFEPYRQFTTAQNPNGSDVVILDNTTREPLHPLELKLVVTPTSGTAHRPRREQMCETVFRPPTAEQVTFSIAYGYTSTRRYDLQTILRENLGAPNDYDWDNASFMIKRIPSIVQAAESIIETGVTLQRPLIMVALWRSQGQKPLLDENAFDTFIWTDLAFVQLFVQTVRKAYLDPSSALVDPAPKEISRPARTLIWLIRSLWDYTTQFTLDFPQVQKDTAYGRQTDKAGAFTTGARDLMMSDEFLYPRVSADEVDNIIHPNAHGFLLPERRLDASLSLRFAMKKLQTGEEWEEQGSDPDAPALHLSTPRVIPYRP